jgi:hypothetical protein
MKKKLVLVMKKWPTMDPALKVHLETRTKMLQVLMARKSGDSQDQLMAKRVEECSRAWSSARQTSLCVSWRVPVSADQPIRPKNHYPPLEFDDGIGMGDAEAEALYCC